MRIMSLSLHTPDGLVIRNVKLSHGANVSNVAMKSNGNFVYAQATANYSIIQEVDQDGKEIYNFPWFPPCDFPGCRRLFVDAYDRVIILSDWYWLTFLDAELNYLEEAEIRDDQEKSFYDNLLNAVLDEETKEMIIVYREGDVFFVKLTL